MDRSSKAAMINQFPQVSDWIEASPVQFQNLELIQGLYDRSSCLRRKEKGVDIQVRITKL